MCSNGQLQENWSGTYTNIQCIVQAKQPKNCLDLNHPETRTQTTLKEDGQGDKCIQSILTQTCNDGTLSDWKETSTKNICTYTNITKEFKYTSSGGTICEPLGGSTGSDNTKGLVGDIRLIKTDIKKDDFEFDKLVSFLSTYSGRQSFPNFSKNDINDAVALRYARTNLANYLDDKYSHKVEDHTLFMKDVNVPNRSFEDGFVNQEGSALKVNEQKLIEFFNLNLKTTLAVETEELEGEYEFAIASDDGARLSISGVGEKKFQYLKSDIEQAQKLICSSNSNSPKYINIVKNKPLDLEINYFQGPRFHIALQLLWRKKNPQDIRFSSYCGQTVKNKMSSLFSKGWEIVPSSILNLPDQYVNTCKYNTNSITELLLPETIAQGLSPETIIKDLKIMVQDLKTNTTTEYPAGVSIKPELTEGKLTYKIELNPSAPILRDSEKVISVIYSKKVIE